MLLDRDQVSPERLI